MTDDDAPAPGTAAEPTASLRERYYQGVITRVYYGSETGTLTSTATGREYTFKAVSVQIIGALPRVAALREGMTVGFDLAWTSRGRRVSVIRVFD